MDIIPSHPYKTDSRAEYRIFTKLQEAFYNDHTYIAFHSLNLTHHETKRFGEGDWFTINRNKQEFKIQDPFRQAEGAVHALDKRIKEHFPSWYSIPIGYGVVFPDVPWNASGSEWAPQTVCDEYKFRNIESWLTKFFRYWKQKNNKRKELSIEQIKELKAYIYSIRNFPIQNISFAEIKNFKGLENEVIIVIDLPRLEGRRIVTNKVLHYVAMTRARSLLCALFASQYIS